MQIRVESEIKQKWIPAGSSKRNGEGELRGKRTSGDVGLQQPLHDPQQLELDDVNRVSSMAALT